MKFRALFLIAIMLVLIVPVLVSAGTGGGATGDDCGTGKAGAPPCDESGVITLPNLLSCDAAAGQSQGECVLSKIFTIMLIVATPLTTLMVLWGAFQMMSAGGNAEKVETARRTIMYAIIGFVVVLFAWSITSIIQGIFNDVTSTAPKPCEPGYIGPVRPGDCP